MIFQQIGLLSALETVENGTKIMSASTRSSTSDPPVSPVNPDEERTSAIGDNPESEPESPVVGDSALETTSHDDVTPIPQPDHQHETESRRSTRGWNVTILCCVSSGHATENDKLPVKDEKQSKKDKAKEKEVSTRCILRIPPSNTQP